MRRASRSAKSALRHAASVWAFAALASCCASSTSAVRSSFHSSTSSCPAFTWSPSWIGNLLIWPPVLSDSFERRRAFTVPARVLDTERSTVPLSTRLITISTGAGRVKCQIRAPAVASNKMIAIHQPCLRFIRLPLFFFFECSFCRYGFFCDVEAISKQTWQFN